MTPNHKPGSLQEQIAEVKKRLEDARARVPKHDVPAALIAEMDELDEELERLQSLSKSSIEAQIAAAEQRLAEAKARIPKHDVPAALIAEIDELRPAGGVELVQGRGQGVACADDVQENLVVARQRAAGLIEQVGDCRQGFFQSFRL